MTEEINSLDFFNGGVPADTIFGISVNNVCKLVKSPPKSENVRDTLAELCFIGLAAYFEAFCKDHFASIINICPEVLDGFCDKRQGLTLEIKGLLRLLGRLDHRLGSLLAEQFDFGSSKQINNLFRDLLGITPFSKKEEKKYSQFLNDRNLLVHHGGIFTLRYQGQSFKRKSTSGFDPVHFDSLVVKPEEVLRWAKFLVEIAQKVSTESFKSLSQFIQQEKLTLEGSRKKAVDIYLRLAWTSWSPEF